MDKMTLRMYLILALLCTILFGCSATDIDTDCRDQLTKYDPHLSAYMGKTLVISCSPGRCFTHFCL